MKIERFFYSDYKKAWENQQEEVKKFIQREERPTIYTLQINEPIAMPSEAYKIIDPKKYKVFLELAKISIPFAKELRANLQIYTEDLTGSIIFVGEELNHTENEKVMLEKLISAADEVHVAISVDTGAGMSTDIDGLVRMEFWFDFYQ